MLNNSCSKDFTIACLSLGQAIVTVASMLSVMLIIVLGNFLVVITVYRDRKLRMQRQNWLIVSLAVADLLVGLLVTPLTLIYEIIGEWRMGLVLCELWLALDVLFVTASILHICAISLDRYFSVTSPLTYPAKRTPTRMFMMIDDLFHLMVGEFCIMFFKVLFGLYVILLDLNRLRISWLVSLGICLPPIFGWHPERIDGECAVSTDIGYVLYSSFGSFYVPVVVLICVYAKIYSITIKHSRQRLKETERRDKTLVQLTAVVPRRKEMPQRVVEVELTEEPSDPNDEEKCGNEAISKVCWHLRKISQELSQVHNDVEKKRQLASFFIHKYKLPSADNDRLAAVEKRKRKLKAKERQATLLLGVILSAFILSWLPFFVMYVIGAFGMEAPPVVFKFFFWLGYCNSGINPIIYTVFNREFKRGLCRQLKKFEQFIEPISYFYK